MWCRGWSLLSWRSYFHGVSHDPLPSTPAREKSVAVSMATRSAVRVVGWLPEVVVVVGGGGCCCWSCTVSVLLFLNMAGMRWGLQAQPGLEKHKERRSEGTSWSAFNCLQPHDPWLMCPKDRLLHFRPHTRPLCQPGRALTACFCFSVPTGTQPRRTAPWSAWLLSRTSLTSSTPCMWRWVPTREERPNTPARRKPTKQWVC